MSTCDEPCSHLFEAATLSAQLVEAETKADALRGRLQTVADEAFGPFPVMTADDLLTEIERGIHRARRAPGVGL